MPEGEAETTSSRPPLCHGNVRNEFHKGTYRYYDIPAPLGLEVGQLLSRTRSELGNLSSLGGKAPNAVLAVVKNTVPPSGQKRRRSSPQVLPPRWDPVPSPPLHHTSSS